MAVDEILVQHRVARQSRLGVFHRFPQLRHLDESRLWHTESDSCCQSFPQFHSAHHNNKLYSFQEIRNCSCCSDDGCVRKLFASRVQLNSERATDFPPISTAFYMACGLYTLRKKRVKYGSGRSTSPLRRSRHNDRTWNRT